MRTVLGLSSGFVSLINLITRNKLSAYSLGYKMPSPLLIVSHKHTHASTIEGGVEKINRVLYELE